MAETTTSEKLISSLIKLSISLPFLGVMYYMSTENKYIDSWPELLSGLFWIIIWFISVLFSVILMGGLLPLNFESAKNKDDLSSGTSPMARFSYEFWIPFIYMMYNFCFPLIIFIAGSEFEFVNKYFNSSISLRQIINAPSPQGRWEDFWWWLGSRVLSILFSPIQNFTSHFGVIPREGAISYLVHGVLFLISLFCMIWTWLFAANTKGLSGSKIDEDNLLYQCYQFIVDRLSLWLDAISSGNIKVVWPWQKNWKKKAIPWQPIVLGIITLIGVYLMYSKNYNIISIFNQNIGEGGSILTLLNVVILIFLFGSNLYYYIRDYGYCFYKNDNPPDNNHRISLMGTFVFFVYFLATFIKSSNSNENVNLNLKYVLIILAIMYSLTVLAQSSLVFDKLGADKDCDDNSSTTNWWKFLFGTSGTWIWLIFLLAIMLDRVIGLFSKKYSFLEIGILPLINNIIRTIMLFIANFIGFMPHWLGNINFGKL